ncbi:MAG: sigma-54 dependent transcriptional regulator [Ginsengibacter sp.]
MKDKEKILIVEDEFIVANDLRIMLSKAGYQVVGIASSAEQARKLFELRKPDWILLDIVLKGEETGIDLAREFHLKKIPFLYISANTNQAILEMAKATEPYGFLVKPFRERDLLVMLDIARYRYGLETGSITSVATNIHGDMNTKGIIGNSAALRKVLEKIQVVAASDTSILILGESGTGKEKAAQILHQLSSRKEKPFVVVNCAALPITLIESELFGHERGAFTGASSKRTGKFEQANGGTIFLDEIGELPLEAQSKLLRVLQEKEIEKLGSDKTIKVDVRIIAATNRNLQKEIAEGRFRLDLYYRLNVFPIELPPLRNRMEDLEALADHFLKKYSRNNGRHVTNISATVLKQMQLYTWPGNIRELEHFIERNVLLTSGNTIDTIEPLENIAAPIEDNNSELKTMEQMEREHILRTLKSSNGKVSGAGGAAEILKIPAQTLFAKMKKLGIKQDYN